MTNGVISVSTSTSSHLSSKSPRKKSKTRSDSPLGPGTDPIQSVSNEEFDRPEINTNAGMINEGVEDGHRWNTSPIEGGNSSKLLAPPHPTLAHDLSHRRVDNGDPSEISLRMAVYDKSENTSDAHEKEAGDKGANSSSSAVVTLNNGRGGERGIVARSEGGKEMPAEVAQSSDRKDESGGGDGNGNGNGNGNDFESPGADDHVMMPNELGTVWHLRKAATKRERQNEEESHASGENRGDKNEVEPEPQDPRDRQDEIEDPSEDSQPPDEAATESEEVLAGKMESLVAYLEALVLAATSSTEEYLRERPSVTDIPTGGTENPFWSLRTKVDNGSISREELRSLIDMREAAAARKAYLVEEMSSIQGTADATVPYLEKLKRKSFEWRLQ
ncbi:hypothetical protein FRB90_003680 [Tulasnella sp. 427]|nr:hypothetical protein FRB90_003680 [Tulasnella sp. 427]